MNWLRRLANLKTKPERMAKMDNLLSAPPVTHLIYIPAILMVGMVIGFLMGRNAGIKEGKAQALGEGDED